MFEPKDLRARCSACLDTVILTVELHLKVKCDGQDHRSKFKVTGGKQVLRATADMDDRGKKLKTANKEQPSKNFLKAKFHYAS